MCWIIMQIHLNMYSRSFYVPKQIIKTQWKIFSYKILCLYVFMYQTLWKEKCLHWLRINWNKIEREKRDEKINKRVQIAFGKRQKYFKVFIQPNFGYYTGNKLFAKYVLSSKLDYIRLYSKIRADMHLYYFWRAKGIKNSEKMILLKISWENYLTDKIK